MLVSPLNVYSPANLRTSEPSSAPLKSVAPPRKLFLLSAGQIAQLVEQWTENPCVAGSIPALPMEEENS